MDSGTASVISAGIVGTVSLVGAVFGPYWTSRWRARAERADAAHDEIGTLLPEYFRITVAGDTDADLAKQVELLARLRFLIGAAEDDIMTIVLDASSSATGRTAQHFGAATECIARWYRGSVSAAEALASYRKQAAGMVPFAEQERLEADSSE